MEMNTAAPGAAGGIAAAYLRRSTADDDNQGIDSRGRQEAAVKRLCGEDVALYVDWGVSGSGAKTGQRAEYARLKSDIAAGRIASVCAESLSRLGRSTRELLDFMDLCQRHGVQVQTDKERVDTSGAMGRFLFTVMAAIGELELDMGKERSAGARAARLKHHQDAGVEMPPSIAIYGKMHVTEGGITRVLDDPDQPIEPVLAAYREAGTIRGACEILNARQVPAPRGNHWGVSTLRRVLEHYAKPENGSLVTLPEVMTKHAGRRPVSASAVFAGLLRCHCGHTMTPNAVRKQYYCGFGRDTGTAAHGHYSVTEAAIRPTLEAEAARYGPQMHVTIRKAEASDAKARAKLAHRRDTYLGQEADSLISREKCRQLVADIDAQVAELDRRAKSGFFLHREVPPSWDDVPAMNRHLRHLWREVRLDADMAPILPLDWIVVPDDENDAIEAAEREGYEPKADTPEGRLAEVMHWHAARKAAKS
jgi:Resolvase, N terminal domain